MFHVMMLPQILEVVESVIGAEILVHPQFNARAKLPDGRSVVPWHQDLGYLDKDAEDTFMVNFWLPLVDATVENGCLEVIRGSHNYGIVPYKNGAEDLVPESIPDGEIVCCPIRVGSVLLIQHKTVHRSTPNFSDHIRWSLDIRYSDPRLPTGRDSVSGFIARSVENPELIAKSHHDWLNLFEL
jgi:ectoine hydroxylase-related dioxygenase (phytanoyl-CoA dioxygenase family)